MSLNGASLSRLLGRWRVEGARDPTYQQLARALRLLILDGRAGLGVRLPGERELADALGVSRTTTTAAYGRLRDEGFVISRRGSGSTTHLPNDRIETESVTDLGGGDGVLDWTATALSAPPGLWQAYQEALRRLPAWLSGFGYDVQGLPCLRAEIARDYERRGCPTQPEQIMVTNGAQHGLAVVLRALSGPGDRIVVDHPTYHNALSAIARSNCQAVPVSLPETGWDLNALTAAFRQTGPRFAYLQPDFHNPTGRLMDVPTRRDLVEAAARTRTPLLIDETMAATGFEPHPIAPVAVHDPAAHDILSLGSVSKRFWGGLRIGWIRASEQRIADICRLRTILDMGTAVMEQLVVTVLLEREDGGSAGHTSNLARAEAAVAMIAEALPHWSVPMPAGGFSLWAEIPRPEASALAAMAQSIGLRIVPGPRFGIDGAFERFVRLPTTLAASDMRRGVALLAEADGRLRGRRRGFTSEIDSAVNTASLI